MITHNDYEVLIEQRRELRGIYEFIVEYGKDVNYQYEGEVHQLGDTIRIRPNPRLFDEPIGFRSLIIDKMLPSKHRLQYIMANVDWYSETDLVVAVGTCGNFLMGYQRIGGLRN